MATPTGQSAHSGRAPPKAMPQNTAFPAAKSKADATRTGKARSRRAWPRPATRVPATPAAAAVRSASCKTATKSGSVSKRWNGMAAAE